MELWITHPMAIVPDVLGAFERFLLLGSMKVKRFQKQFHVSLIQFVIAVLNPFPAFPGIGAKDDLSDFAQVLFGVESVEDLDGLGEQLRGGVPDPGGSIAQDNAAWSLGEASP